MKSIALIPFFLILISCNNSTREDNQVVDDYYGTWHSLCNEGKGEGDSTDETVGSYFITEYIFYDSVIELNLFVFDDLNCLIPNKYLSFMNVADIEYTDYESISTRADYQARWYNSFIQPNDLELDPIEYKQGFYLEGDTLYPVYYNAGYNDYAVSFSEPYNRQ